MMRIKHWRGHGIHSPFVYGLVRKVVMNDCIPKELPVSHALPECDVRFLERLYAYLGYDNCIIAGESVFMHAGKGKVAEAYSTFTKEVLYGKDRTKAKAANVR